ncbi:MAG: 2-dehydropantoate 2-reductase [Pseudomonadales bacterium]|nr:2-dehydropantoate 2-reductase [Pseudomonadales bacterium]
MKICIYGAGAIGCWLAAHLHRVGYKPNLVARGAHLDTLKRDGLQITEASKSQSIQVKAFGDQDDLTPQDLIIVTLKAHSISPALHHLTSLIHENTYVLFAVNGVPWWFFYGLGGGRTEQPLHSVDPNGRIWKEIGPQRTIGCVLYPAVELIAPGVIRHVSGDRISIGEPKATNADRTERIATILSNAGCRTAVRRDIRNEIWIKLWGNVAFNPLSVITGGTLDRLATDPGTQYIATRLMEETREIGSHYGARFGMTIRKRIEGAASVGPHKTSMLQDYLQGKPLETSAVLDAVLELASLARVDAPTIRMVQSILHMKLSTERSET